MSIQFFLENTSELSRAIDSDIAFIFETQTLLKQLAWSHICILSNMINLTVKGSVIGESDSIFLGSLEGAPALPDRAWAYNRSC